MPDTTPDRPADQLRAAAGHAPSPELARLLETLADASDHHTTGEGGFVATVVHPALAVARQLLGTTTEPESGCAHCGSPDHSWDDCAAYTALVRDDAAAAPPAPADRAATRDRIRRAICEASGFDWLPDELMEPDEYGEHADAVLAVLGAPADRAAVLREAATALEKRAAELADHADEQASDALEDRAQEWVWAADHLRRLAGEAAAGAHQTEQALRVRIRELAGSWRLGADEGDLGPGWASAAAALFAVVDNPYITHTEVGLDHPATTGRVPAVPAAPEETTPAPQCSAGLLPPTDEAVDRCVRHGAHDTHVTAAGVRWPNEDPEL
ncbi:hypothetical protein AB0B51_33180 [Streptomyces griseus]|uniref:hypothetical protein n=1 Tax=Streptomyces griseus TaxID=1911 RepID=UPI0004C661AF|nr:hypothetical protein [Streptomyces griseus]